jgi:hypothetical protein
MWRTDIQQNPDGTWCVLVWDQGSGFVKIKNPKKEVHRDNISTHDEALEIATRVAEELNSR